MLTGHENQTWALRSTDGGRTFTTINTTGIQAVLQHFCTADGTHVVLMHDTPGGRVMTSKGDRAGYRQRSLTGIPAVDVPPLATAPNRFVTWDYLGQSVYVSTDGWTYQKRVVRR